jgi:transposase
MPSPGRRPKLTSEQQTAIPTLLARGAEAYGFVGNGWTQRRVAAVLRREFGVCYHPASMTHLLRSIGWSPQRPQTRATQRDEAVIRAWFTERWPALSAKLSRSTAPCSS